VLQCQQPDGGADVTGPFTGATHRFVVERILLPQCPGDYAADLNGDGHVHNQFGNIVELEGEDMQSIVDAMLAAGTISPTIEITSDDDQLQNDPTVGIAWLDSPKAVPATVGGALVSGQFRSNRAAYTHDPVSVSVRLPVAPEADPSALPIVGLEISLDPDGKGGFDGEVHGAVHGDIATIVNHAMLQMISNDPVDHPLLLCWLDANGNGQLDPGETFSSIPIIENVTAPDIQLFDENGHWKPCPTNQNRDSLSLGFGIHLIPCARTRCLPHAPPSCLDRIQNGDETGVDCGGSCRVCNDLPSDFCYLEQCAIPPFVNTCRQDADCGCLFSSPHCETRWCGGGT
jgi:hypothetical protein